MAVRIGRPLSLWFFGLLPLATGHCTGDNDASLPLDASTTGLTGTTGEEDPVPTTGSAEGPGATDVSTTSTGASADESTGSSSTGLKQPSCGDGVIQENEECDEGIVDNVPGGSCLPDCVAARCGDGLVQAGVEECDFGDGVNEYKYGGCIPNTCKWGPRCGDGDVDPPNEVCDPGDPNSQEGELVGCDASCRFKGRLVFLTSVAFTGNLGGLAGADSLCRDLAAGFDGAHADKYIAWLSDAETSPIQRIHHGADYGDTPYVLRSGVQIAANFDDLIDEGPLPGIDITDTYETLVDVPVWTNTAIDGSRFSGEKDCEGWGSDSAAHTARIGRNRLQEDSPDLGIWQQLGQWTSWKATSCDLKRRLYCFEN